MKPIDDFEKTSTPKARKEHRCDVCGQMIRKGERYFRRSGSVENSLFTTAKHSGCAKAEEWEAASVVAV